MICTADDANGFEDGSDGISLTIDAGATISGGDEGVQAGDGLTLTNDGDILAADEGIEAGDGLDLTNSGLISAADDAVQSNAGASLRNTGTIESAANDAIDIDNGTIDNHGTIRGLAGAEDGIDFDPAVDATVTSEVTNRAGAVIEGAIGINTDPANVSSQHVRNDGTITGRSGIALLLGAGDDSVTAGEGGIFNGTVDLGSGSDIATLCHCGGGVIGGGALFDGGEDADTAGFSDLSTTDLFRIGMAGPLSSDVLRLIFRTADGSRSTVNLTRFESFAFADRTVSASDLAGIAPVPVPAPALLLAGALAGLALAGRRRA